MTIKLSIIIVNYNGIRFLKECINSISNHISFEYEIVVVDNCSQDDSVHYLRKNHPEVILVEQKNNLGFAGGNNAGADVCRGKYIMLLNNDTVVKKHLDPLIDILENDKKIGVVGCEMMYENGRVQESVGNEHDVLRILMSWFPLPRKLQINRFRRTVSCKSDIYQKDCIEVDWVSGALMISPKSVWQKLGGLDPDYFMYVEDVDYCRRIRNAGLKVVYSNRSKILHFEGAGRPWIGEFATLSTMKSYIIFVRKFEGVVGLAFLRVFMPVIMLLRACLFLILQIFGSDAYGRVKALSYLKAATLILTGGRLFSRT